jgi:large subunit ribosomal protein L24
MKKAIPYTGKCHIKTGDTVVLLTGPQAVRGKTGTVIKVWPTRQRALVEGECAQYHTKHVKPNPQANEEGGRQQRLRPIHTSNLALLDPTTGKPCRIRREREGKNVIRISKQSGHRFE